MSAFADGLRWFGALLLDTANGLDRPAPERASPPEHSPLEVDEELRRMRERVQGRYY